MGFGNSKDEVCLAQMRRAHEFLAFVFAATVGRVEALVFQLVCLLPFTLRGQFCAG